MVALNKTYRKTLTPDRSAKDSGRRFYSAEISRWLSRDPIGESEGMALYEFVRNYPLGYVDPRGSEVIVIQGSRVRWGEADTRHVRDIIETLKKEVKVMLDFFDRFPETKRVFINGEEMDVREAKNRISELLPREPYPVLEGGQEQVVHTLAGIFAAATDRDMIVIVAHTEEPGVFLGIEPMPLSALYGTVMFGEQIRDKSVVMDCCFITESEAQILHDKLKANYLYYFPSGEQTYRLDGFLVEPDGRPNAENGYRIKLKIELKSNRMLLWPPDAPGLPIAPDPEE
jgi:RHS repeat-associated protein